MNAFADLSHWWNLIFVVPFCFGAVLVLLSLPGTGRRGGHRGAHRAARHSVGRAGGGGSRSTTASARSHTGRSGMKGQRGRLTKRRTSKEPAGWAETLHVQNIPPLMLLQNFLLFWGIFGWAANQFFARGSADPVRFIVPSLLAAFCGTAVMTLALSALLSRFTPTDETYVVTKSDLIGRAGEAVSAITERMGSVYVRDGGGTLHHLAGRIPPDRQPIAKGKTVLVIDYQPEGDYYWVKEWSPDGENTDREARLGGAVEPPLPASQIEKPYRAWRWLVGSNPPF
ncbi:MAG: YqiJ family protein [Armatimonadota bacterium]|nr:YqiJ family protein [Armatimonadota bacterium]